MTSFLVTLNLVQGLQFDGVRRHPLNAPPKKLKAKRGDSGPSPE